MQSVAVCLHLERIEAGAGKEVWFIRANSLLQFFSMDGWMDGWMDVAIHTQTDE